MNIFDLHSDTPFDLFRLSLSLFDNEECAVSIKKTAGYEKKIFVIAFWSDDGKLPDDCFYELLQSSPYLDSQIEMYSDFAAHCYDADSLERAAHDGKFGVIKAVEGAKLLNGDLSRLEALYSLGIRQILPVWKGSDDIGGAWDTGDGLTDFGKALVSAMAEKKIVVDTSHMSRESFWDTAKMVNGPVVASHSNAFEICGHMRNLDREQIKHIISSKGIIGINLCQAHVDLRYSEGVFDAPEDFLGAVLKHVTYYLENGAEKALCLGCDWDGTKLHPTVSDVSMARVLYERMLKEGISSEICEDVFFNNAYRFYKSFFNK